VMLIMLVTGLKENQPVVTVSSWERIWYPGLAKDKHLLQCLQQKQNTFQLQVVVHHYSGWNISWKTIRLVLTVFLSFVIILLLFVCQRIQFYIIEPSTLKSNIILLETMFKKGLWIYNSLILNISWKIWFYKEKFEHAFCVWLKLLAPELELRFWSNFRSYSPSEALNWDSEENVLLKMTSAS